MRKFMFAQCESYRIQFIGNYMFISNIFKIIKSMFIKETIYPCIVWDGKTMNYMNLTQTKIENIRNSKEREGWSVTIHEDKIT